MTPWSVGRNVRRLLEAMPGTGKIRAGQLMSDLGVSDRRRARGLGAAQRARLLALFDTAQ